MTAQQWIALLSLLTLGSIIGISIFHISTTYIIIFIIFIISAFCFRISLVLLPAVIRWNKYIMHKARLYNEKKDREKIEKIRARTKN